MDADKNRDDFKYVDVVYSLNRVRFITRCSIEEQRGRIPETELLKHCIPVKDINTGEPSLISVHVGKKGRDHGFKTKLEATACNDVFIDIIKMCDVGAISHLEVAIDIIFATTQEAEEYGEWFENNIQRRNKRHNVSFKLESTLYLGKQEGDKKTKNFIRSYPRESKLVGEPCYHIEFVLEGADAIKKALGIRHYKELTSSMEMYYQLENKYLQFRTEGDLPLYRAFTEPKKKKFGSIYISRDAHKRLKDRLKKK